eukprot:GGOE01021221.1.p1 GENE.GGOE01021221.1~~GGOE01021221.1.p1  ORF type:complete len:495 (-),score=66.23 GGOE01021221.1:169-1476(-)
MTEPIAQVIPKANLASEQCVDDISQHIVERCTDQQCSACGMRVPTELLDVHKAERCSYRKIACIICDLPILAKDKAIHDQQCGARTDVCPSCGSRILLRDFAVHQQVCSKNRTSRPSPPGRTTEPMFSKSAFTTDGTASQTAVPSQVASASRPMPVLPSGTIRAKPQAAARREIDLTSYTGAPSPQPAAKAPDTKSQPRAALQPRAVLHQTKPSPVASSSSGSFKRPASGSSPSTVAPTKLSMRTLNTLHGPATSSSSQTAMPGSGLGGAQKGVHDAPMRNAEVHRLPKASSCVSSVAPTRPSASSSRPSLYDELCRVQFEASEELANRIDEYERAMATTSDKALAAAIFEEEKHRRELMVLNDELLAAELHAQEQEALARSPQAEELLSMGGWPDAELVQRSDEQLARVLAEGDGSDAMSDEAYALALQLELNS